MHVSNVLVSCFQSCLHLLLVFENPSCTCRLVRLVRVATYIFSPLTILTQKKKYIYFTQQLAFVSLSFQLEVKHRIELSEHLRVA